jgi:hypothetical protein
MSTALMKRAAKGSGWPAYGWPHHEVPERPKRRRFTAECKLAILKEADAAIKPGEIGALLLRKGCYSESWQVS